MLGVNIEVEVFCSKCGKLVKDVELDIQTSGLFVLRIAPCESCLEAEYNLGYEIGEENND